LYTAGAETASKSTIPRAVGPADSTALTPTALAAPKGAHALPPPPTGPAAQSALAAFGKIDADGSGGITRIELIKAVRTDGDIRATSHSQPTLSPRGSLTHAVLTPSLPQHSI
jgi:hypothetical protein